MSPMNSPPRSRTVPCPCGDRVTHTMSGLEAVEWAACAACGARHPFSSYVKIDIGVSEFCNLKCQMCRRPSEAKFIEAEWCKRVLTEATRLGVEVLSFSGGEPFVHPKIVDILEHAFNLGVRVQMVSNGTLIKRHQLDLLSKLDCLTISVDGLGEVHDRIRGQDGSFARTERLLKWLPETTISWGTNTVIQRDNVHQLYDLFRHVQSIGGRRYAYCGFSHVEVVPETVHLQLTPDEEEEALAQLLRIDRDCAATETHFNDREQLLGRFEIFARKERRFRPRDGCRIPQKFIGLTAHGFYLCWHTGRNIHAETLLEALESDAARALVREGLEKRCVACNTFNYSWDGEWTEGILASIAAGEEGEAGVVSLGVPSPRAMSGPTSTNTLVVLDD
jgi:MoaA/NifB/PqqE/SkfB family radical SAM enzyme